MAPAKSFPAKLTRPRMHDMLPRTRLFARLNLERSRRRALCVIGPPGAGKSSLRSRQCKDCEMYAHPPEAAGMRMAPTGPFRSRVSTPSLRSYSTDVADVPELPSIWDLHYLEAPLKAKAFSGASI